MDLSFLVILCGIYCDNDKCDARSYLISSSFGKISATSLSDLHKCKHYSTTSKIICVVDILAAQNKSILHHF